MKQARVDSFMEAVTNTAIGWFISMVTWHFVALAFGIPMPLAENLAITGIFTVVSVVRQYVLRRVFDGKTPWAALKAQFNKGVRSGRVRKYSDDLKAKACEMRERGITVNVISRLTGIRLNSLDYILLRGGADSPRLAGKAPTRRPPYTRKGKIILSFSEQEDDYLRENANRLSYGAMARHMGRSFWSVRNRLLTLARHAARAEATEIQ